MEEEKCKKKLLLIAPLFFGYYKEIKREAELQGYDVDYICDSPSDSNISKALGRINKKFIVGSTKKYFNEEVIPVIKDKEYDCVLVVAGMTFSFTPEMVNIIRTMNDKAIFVMYQWDSEKNLPYSTRIHQYFDEVYSFDRYDCQSKTMYKFLPLFYTRKYEDIGKEDVDSYLYDCSYIGTAHPKKYKSINEISKTIKKIMPRQFIYHYMPSKLKYIYHKVLAPEFRGARLKDFKQEKVSSEEVMQVFKQSKCILDSPQAGQTGLTIRTLECLGANRKMITVNEDIRYYDFYREENILIYDGNINEESCFFTSDYQQLPDEIYEKYSLRNWLSAMIG